MCPCYAEIDVLFGHQPNVTPIASYDSQEKEILNGDDDDDVFLDKDNNGLESPLNMDPLLNNDDSLVPVENLQVDLETCEVTNDLHLEWDSERWNEDKMTKIEKQWFEEVKLQKQMEFDEKKHAKKHEFEKEKWNWEWKIKEKHCQMDLNIVALSSSRQIAELEQILTLINKK
ncbi:hypothetical protein O181_115921 [Austropuccinia psidii MF-1]|uniref:Uncharacterized protein n=1 Tax=Austropuccinia psidii MF-1 TaxID=1389203 RepID=A0A9Q3K9Q9_9BASI|nr:hypothetical protein [Austropuccinia psidii MF-1]